MKERAATFIPESVESFKAEQEVLAAAHHTPDRVRPPWEALTDAELPYAGEIKAACAELSASAVGSKDKRSEIFLTPPPAAAAFDFSLEGQMPTAVNLHIVK